MILRRMSSPRLGTRPWLIVAPIILVCAAGCAGTGSAERGTSNRTAASTASNQSASALEATLAEVEERYVIGPMAARELGYRVDWQYPEAGNNLRLLTVQHDAVFALDDRNYLTRIDRQRGHRLWRLPVAEAVQEIQGLVYIPEDERVYLASGGSLIVLDATNGSQVGRQDLQRIASTAPFRFGQFLIYGSRNGQLIWHSFEVAFQWKAYQVSNVIEIAPKLHENIIITVGTDGRIMAHDVASGNRLWDKKLISGVVAEPAIGERGVFIASTDQHLWAYDLRTGRNLWRYLTESPLTDPPAFADDRVYQYIESEGLVCFEAFPVDRPGGVVVWTNEDIHGNVVGARGRVLFAWNEDARTLVQVDAGRGGTMLSLDLPKVDHLVLSNRTADEIYASSADGRVVRLLPRNLTGNQAANQSVNRVRN